MIDELRDGRAGVAVLPGDADWNENPPIFAPSGDAAAEVRPQTPAQVAAALRFAEQAGIPVAVRSGGHGSRYFTNDGALIIGLQHFGGVEVDGSTVRVGSGAEWGDVALALAPHGLGLSAGDTKSVGVGGLTLGGGIGWLVRQHGLAIDALVSAQVALPSGELVTASGNEHPDLFWALRGGGGNFGVVTEFVFQAYPLDGALFGSIHYTPGDEATVLKGWRDVMRDAPEQLNATFISTPAFGPTIPADTVVKAFWPGRDETAAKPWLERLREVAGYLSDDIRPMDYADTLDEAPRFGPQMPTVVGGNGFADDLSDAAIDAIVATRIGLGPAVLSVRYLRGAYNRVPVDATAWAPRNAEGYVMLAALLPPNAAQDEIDRVHAAWRPMFEHTRGTYGNFADNAGAATIELMYPPRILARLRQVKRRYDPHNVLRGNHNVEPAISDGE
jgi:FAD/FMN-containing dehydrogenase